MIIVTDVKQKNKRYLPHELTTKINFVKLYRQTKEQKAISKQLAAIRYEIDAHNATFEEIVEKLTLVMDMLEDCGATYRKANENIKRLMNQSIFKKIWINPDGSVEPKMTKICEGVFEAKRDIKKSAPTAMDADSIRKLFKSGSNFLNRV